MPRRTREIAIFQRGVLAYILRSSGGPMSSNKPAAKTTNAVVVMRARIRIGGDDISVSALRAARV